MSHNEFDAQPELQLDVKCYWTLEESLEIYNNDDILPDSNVEIVFNCGAPLMWGPGDGTQVELPRAFLKGLQIKPLPLRASGLTQLVALRLYPWSLHTFLDSPPDFTNAPIVPLGRTWQNFAIALEASVHHYGYVEAVNVLRQFIGDTHHRPLADLTPLRAAGELLYESQGRVRISEIATRCFLSLSQFERRFKQLTGVTPKTFARLVRFEAVRDSMFGDSSRSPVELAHAFGYTDQAHLIHDFKSFAARTPGEAAAQLQHAEFLQYS